MIFRPRIGQNVTVHYGPQWRELGMPLQGQTGTVAIGSKGPGPRNVGILIQGQLFVVPRGNLIPTRGRGEQNDERCG